jgi:hypothetical protein
MPYHYNALRLFADCRAVPPDPADIAYLASLEEKPEEILIILVELGAMEAAYDYALAHPAAWNTAGQGTAAVRDVFDYLVQHHADDKARHLARVTGMRKDKAGQCWTFCGLHGSQWWSMPIDMGHILARRADLFAFTLAQEVEDPRARFLTLMTMYYGVPQDSVDQFPHCTGYTRACVLAAMVQIAVDDEAARVSDLGLVPDEGTSDTTSFMYAVISEFARIAGDAGMAHKMAAQIKKPAAPLAAEVSEGLLALYQGKVAAAQAYPPKHDFPRPRYAGLVPESARTTVHRYPALNAAIAEMDRDMRRHSWRYYSATMSRDMLPSDEYRYGNRCLLDRGRFPYKVWPAGL